jgi:hypothetical protein
VTQEELEKLKAEGHDDEFVVYSEEQDDKTAVGKSSPPAPSTTTTTTTVRPVTVKVSPPAPVGQTAQAQQSKNEYANIEYDNSVELITGSPIEFIDYSKPRDIVVKTSFSHTGSAAAKPPSIPHAAKPKTQVGDNAPSAPGWRSAVEAVPLEDSIKFVIPKELKKPTVDYGGFHPIN